MFFPEFQDPFQQLLEQTKGQRIAVLGHLRPDGDCIGSQVALTRILRSQGIDAIAINQHAAPRILSTFLGDTPYHTFDTLADEHKTRTSIQCDCADAARIGDEIQQTFPTPLANIDHHITNDNYARLNFVDAKAAATAEILAGLFFDAQLPIDPTTAQALYVGIATDTGQFRFPSTTSRVFQITGQLLDCGANPAGATNELYENESFAKLKLLEYFLGTLTLHCNGLACIGTIPNGIYEKYGAHRDDSEGIVDYARCIQGVEIGVLLEERGDILKGSLRAKESRYRVDILAQSLSGGGHTCAAGFSQETSIETFYPTFLEKLERHLQNLPPVTN